jgi:nucleoside-diphosphate-sugar epimerase
MIDGKTKRVLVTGAGGYLGGRIGPRLSELGAIVRRWSRDASRLAPWSGPNSVEDISGDLHDPVAWDRALDAVDVVFHLAAQTSAYRASEDPAEDLASNVGSVVALLESCRRHGGRPAIVFASTATVIGLTYGKEMIDESVLERPVTVYDLHKWVAEQYLFTYSRLGIARATALRLANVYGPGPTSASADRGVLNRMVRKALSGEPLTIYGTGEQVRDYVYIDDVVRAFVAAANGIDGLDGRPALIGSGTGCTIAGMVRLVAARVTAQTGRTVEVRHVEPPPDLLPIEQRSFIADCRRFAAATGWRAEVSLEDGIDRTIAAAATM